jgi:hypothetical protein
VISEAVRAKEAGVKAEGARMKAKFAAMAERKRTYEKEMVIVTAHNRKVVVYLEGLGKLQRKTKVYYVLNSLIIY